MMHGVSNEIKLSLLRPPGLPSFFTTHYERTKPIST